MNPDELNAEFLLAATGLVARPDRDTERAAGVLMKTLREEFIAALDAEAPRRLSAIPTGATYFDRLARSTQSYEPVMEMLEATHGLAFAGLYVSKHQSARQWLMDRHPANEVDSVMGVTPAPPDTELLAQWELEVDVVENQRIFRDLRSGALLQPCLDTFQACFPAIWAELVVVIQDERVKRRQAKWVPAPWLEAGLRVLLGMPADPGTALAPAAPPPPKPGVTKLDTTALETAATEQPAK